MRTRNKAASRPHHGHGGPARGAEGHPSAGSRIVAAVEEATELLRREGLESPRITVRTHRLPPAPRDYRPDDVKR